MSVPQNILSGLPAREPVEILEALAAYKRESHHMPVISLYLDTGKVVQGLLIDLEEKRSNSSRALVVQVMGSTGVAGDEVLYVKIEIIKAVIVHRASSLVNILSRGIIDLLPAEPPPSRLDIRRTLQQFASELSEMLGCEILFSVEFSGMPGDVTAWWSLHYLLQECMGSMRKIAGQAGGKEALSKMVKEIRIMHDEQRHVTLDSGVLCVKANLNGGKTGRFTGEEITDDVEKLL